jgi:hypothetical protein
MKVTFKAFTLLTCILGSALSSMAQSSTPKIAGQIIQAGNKPIEFATVTLLKAQDSSLVKGAIADINGKYEFESVKQGKYLIAAAYVGMAKGYSKTFDVNGSSVKINAIELMVDAKNLKVVDVTAKRPFIEQKADKMVVNVENSIAAAGGTALEVLQKSPGVTVDKDDNISMKGKGGVVVMIDGKLTNMSSQDVAQLLKSMPSSNIDQIELISNPSAKYDAAGNAGIINIKLKKNKNYGTNGSVSMGTSYGLTPKWNGGLNLNNRNEKVNLFGSLNHNHYENEQRLGLYRSGPENDKTIVYDQLNNMKSTSNYYAGKVGADYFINKNHTVGVMVDVAYRNQRMPTHVTTNIGNGSIVDSILKTYTNNTTEWNRWAYNVNYKGILDTTGKELNIDLDYARNVDNSAANIYAQMLNPEGKGNMHSDTSRNLQPATVDIKTFKVDYVQPLKKGIKFETGFKLSLVETDNNALFDSLKSDKWIHDDVRSNQFLYKENINAAYINFSKQFKKVGVQLGLRAEQSNVKGNSITTAQITDTSYLNLFPTVFVSYAANKDNQLGISYSRRIQRPSYEDLNPFEFYLDRFTKMAGNPYLKPQYSQNIELTHTFKQFLITSIGYTHIKDQISRILEADRDVITGDTSIMRYKYLNVAKSDVFNLNVSVPFPITKWWNSFTTMSASYTKYQTVVNENKVDLSSGGFFGRTQHTFTLGKGISTEVAFMYISSQISNEGLFRMKPMYALDLGVQKTVLKKKGTLKLNVTDVFNTQRFRGEFENLSRFTSVSSKWESQMVRLNFNYRFGNTNVKAARNRQTGLQDEQRRVKEGN